MIKRPLINNYLAIVDLLFRTILFVFFEWVVFEICSPRLITVNDKSLYTSKRLTVCRRCNDKGNGLRDSYTGRINGTVDTVDFQDFALINN